MHKLKKLKKDGFYLKMDYDRENNLLNHVSLSN